MTDTIRTEAALQTLLATNGNRAIRAQEIRDLLVSVPTLANAQRTQTEDITLNRANGWVAYSAVMDFQRHSAIRYQLELISLTLDGETAGLATGELSIVDAVIYSGSSDGVGNWKENWGQHFAWPTGMGYGVAPGDQIYDTLLTSSRYFRSSVQIITGYNSEFVTYAGANDPVAVARITVEY